MSNGNAGVNRMKHERAQLAELLIEQCDEHALILVELAAMQALETRDEEAHRKWCEVKAEVEWLLVGRPRRLHAKQ